MIWQLGWPISLFCITSGHLEKCLPTNCGPSPLWGCSEGHSGLGSPWVNLRNKEHQARIFDHMLNCVGYWTDFPGNRAFSVGCDYMQGPHIHGNPQGEWCEAQLSWLSLNIHNSSGIGRCTHFACFSCSRHCLAQKSKARVPCWGNDRICFGHLVILNKRAWMPYGPCSSVLWIAVSHLGKSSSLLGSGHRKQWVFLDTRCLCYLIFSGVWLTWNDF